VDITSQIQTVLILALPVLFAITVPAVVRGRTAARFGDHTAAVMGRLTLNPIKHIDPIGTLLIPIVLYFATSGALLFGYAKPIPFDPDNLRNPKRDLIWVSLSAPAANFAMALAWAIFFVVLRAMDISEPFFVQMAQGGVLVNLVMWAFNLFPLPPLDGGRILAGLLPDGPVQNFLARIEPYGFFIVMALVLTGVLRTFWLNPLMTAGSEIIKIFLIPFAALML
jgi:Zn-dependent protease